MITRPEQHVLRLNIYLLSNIVTIRENIIYTDHLSMNSLKIPNGYSESVNRRSTDKTIT